MCFLCLWVCSCFVNKLIYYFLDSMYKWYSICLWLTSLGEGNGNPLQYSCLENPRDRGAWWAVVYGVAQSRTQLKQLSMHACIVEGNGNPLQYSCLETPRDRGAWWAAVYGVTQSQTRLKRLSSSSSTSFRMTISRCIHVAANGIISRWEIMKETGLCLGSFYSQRFADLIFKFKYYFIAGYIL